MRSQSLKFRHYRFLSLTVSLVAWGLLGAGPSVVLESPPDGSVVNDTKVSFTCSATDTAELQDATLYLASGSSTQTFSEAVDAQLYATDDPSTSETEDQNTNSGSNTAINVDGENPHSHAVIKFPYIFDSAGGPVPSGAYIVSATLEVDCFNAGDLMELYRLTEDWMESEVTWNERSAGSPWTDPGADGTGSNAGVAVNGDFSATGLRSIDITQFVQQWSDGASNYGVVLTNTGTDGVDFDSSEGTTPPVLTVTYQTWTAEQTKTLSGTSDTVTFDPVTLTDNQDYTWNCLVTNTSNEEAWAPADFSLTVGTDYPDQPALLSPADYETEVSLFPELQVSVSDPQGESLDVAFYGREATGGEDFSIVVLPDTQYYSESYPDVFNAQTQWIADNVGTENIAFVTHEGDIVQTWDSTTQWENANTAMSKLDPSGNFVVPYAVLPGNHDMDSSGDTTPYNNYFPCTRFNAQTWYGGNYPEGSNDNSYQLFSAGGDDYLIIHLRYSPGGTLTDPIIAWADSILKTYPGRKAIITTHAYLNSDGTRRSEGDGIWALVQENENVYFVLCGHIHSEAMRTDLVNGREVHQLLADYQGRSNGGNGWLRIMRFAPSEDLVYVETYSPYLNQYETDADSQFTLNLPMSGFSHIGTITGISSGTGTSIVWSDLLPYTEYEWYVTVTDTNGNTQTGPVWHFTTGQGNQSPVAQDDTAETTEDTPIDIDVLANDSDPDGDPLDVTGVSDPSYGSASINSDDTVNYTPNTGFNGTDSFTYTITDGTDTASATVSVTVTGVNDPPAANDDSYSTDEDTQLDVAAPGVLSNDSDPEGDILTASVGSGPSNGTLTLNGDGSFSYLPNSNFSGSDSFTYTASDGSSTSNEATVSITVNAVNDPPVADNKSVETDEDAALGITLTATDIENDPLTYRVTSGPSHGSLSGTAPDVTYTPDADYNGADSFDFVANDGTQDSNVATVSVTINPVGDSPVANDDTATTEQAVAVTVDVLANDSDVDGDSLAVTNLTQPSSGTAALNDDQTVTYTPSADFTGDDSFTYTANDGTYGSSTATVTVTVTASQPDTLFSDGFESGDLSAGGWTEQQTEVDSSAAYGGSAYGALIKKAGWMEKAVSTAGYESIELQFARRAEGLQSGEYLYVEFSVDAGSTWSQLESTQESTWSLVAVSCSSTAEDNPGFMVRFRLNGNQGNDQAMVDDVKILGTPLGPPNNPPVATDDSYSTHEDTELAVAAPGVLSNDSDADGDSLSALLDTGPANGSLTLNSDGSFTYTPDADFNGEDSFTYAASDGRDDSNVATATITVNAVGDSPVANNDTAGTQVDTAVTIDVLANDTDADGDPLTVTNLTQPSNGSVTLKTDQTVTYTPNTGYSGEDNFTYTANDGTSDSSAATVTVTVQESVGTMHVDSIVVTQLDLGKGAKRGRAEVVIVDSLGQPVSGATVTGDFTGDISETGVSAATDGSGKAILETSNTTQGRCHLTFTVTNVEHLDYEYDSSSNVETSDTSY